MSIEKTAKGWRVRMRYGGGQRGRFDMPEMDEPLALAREQRLIRMARTLASAGKVPEASALLPMAAAATSEKLLQEVEAKAREVVATAGVEVKPRGPRTFRDVAELWTSGELRRRFPDAVREKGDRTVSGDKQLLTWACAILGEKPVDRITIEDAEEAKAAIPAGLAQGTRRHYALIIRRVMSLAEYPLRLIDRSPIPPRFVPPQGKSPAFPFLYPEEDEALLTCPETTAPLGEKIVYGFLPREGTRGLSEALKLTWSDIDLVKGVLTLDRNKTGVPRSWKLRPDVVRALAAYKGGAKEDELVFPEFARSGAPARFRAHLHACGIRRRELHARTKERRPIRLHDLRATFVTLSLAEGKSETWVMDRTGHTTSKQLNRYRRLARHAAELELGPLGPLDELLGLGQKSGLGGEMPHDFAGTMHTGSKNSSAELLGTGPIVEATPPSVATQKGSGPAGFEGVGHDPLALAESALAQAALLATQAGQWDLAMALTRELGERRRSREHADVPSLGNARKRKNGDQ